MPADIMTPQETEALRAVYQRDVRYWSSWSTAIRAAKRDGKAMLGLHWVILPYKAVPELPPLRQQINTIYYQCLQEYAQSYRLGITVDSVTNKVVLYDPERVEADWLTGCNEYWGRCLG